MKLLFTIALCAAALPLHSEIIRVSPGADPQNTATGASWDSATNFQRALALAVEGDEIWVEEGRYAPDEGQGQTDDLAFSSFSLADGIALYGGFSGTELTREPTGGTSLLSGTLTPDDAESPIFSSRIIRVPGGSGTIMDNFTVSFTDNPETIPPNSTLIAFEISGRGEPLISRCHVTGSGNNPAITAQGGTFVDCTIIGGASTGLEARFAPASSIINCTFLGSETGAINLRGDDATITGCTFEGNSTSGFGGAIKVSFADAIIDRCRFDGNSSGRSGGAIDLDNGATATISNSLFTNNAAGTSLAFFAGGAISIDARDGMEGSATITGCTFVRNSSPDDLGGAIDNGGSGTTITNCIFWENTSAESEPDAIENTIANFGGATPTISNSIVQHSGGSGAGYDTDAGIDGGGNLDTDPLFVGANDFQLSDLSPAINAGAAAAAFGDTDLAGNPRTAGPAPDMGAFEFTNTVSPVPMLSLSIATTSLDGQTFPLLIYPSDLDVIVEQSTDALRSWDEVSDLVLVSTDDGIMTVRTPSPVEAGAVFFRLRAN